MSRDFRLPRTVIPSHYDLSITPNLETDTFEGTVSIAADIAEATSSITLNADGLRIVSTTIEAQDKSYSVEAVVNAQDERLLLETPQPLPPGPVQIDISFKGMFDEQLVGLYASTFSVEGVDHKLATTQFEATHARKCFPCWDEPDFKATFSVSLTVPEGLTAIGNSGQHSVSPQQDGTSIVTFEPTIRMSTYLVAFAVGPFEMTDPVDVDGVTLRVVHVPGKGDLTAFALEVGAFALRYFTDYFGIPYPGKKLDLVAIPDFAFGAMENLGCVTFREVLLLIDPETATPPELQRAADVINHEIAHMWFGDLVTMKWWNGLWLNEAFATFMEMKCTDAFRPEWQRWVEFGVSRTAAFSTDSLTTTRPIEYEVVNPEDAEGMFDILTYEKGAAVVRMAELYLGDSQFQAGIARYMKQHAYGNAETTDLWTALEAETGSPVPAIMDSWIFQGGYPTVSAEVKGDRVTFSQQRSLPLTSSEETTEADQSLWSAPIRYRWLPENSDEPKTAWTLLTEQSATIQLEAAPQWLVLNAEGSSFLRTSYSDDQLSALSGIGATQLSAIERYNLIDDTWAAVLAGQRSTLSFLNLLETMAGEMDRSVWLRTIQGLHQLHRLVQGDAQNKLEEIAHDILSPALASLELSPADNEDDRTRQLRGDLIRAFGTVANNHDIQQEAKRAVIVEARTPGTVDAAVLAAAVDVVAHCGDETDFDDFVNRWRSAATPQTEQRYLAALCNFGDDNLVEKLRQFVLSGEVRSQDGPSMLRRALTNQHAGKQTWEFIKQHWEHFNAAFPTASIVRMVDGIAYLTSPEDVVDTQQFFAENPVSSGQLTLSQILERQRVLSALARRESDRLSAFLAT